MNTLNTFSNVFQHNFEIIKAVTPELIDEAHKLRYQVYCEEKGYEDASCYPDRREFDEYDTRSIHCLIRHRFSGIYIGVARLVLPRFSDVDQPLPIEQHCQVNLAESHPHLAMLPRESIGEASRFSVSRVYRRRVAEQGLIWGVCKEGESFNSDFLPSFNRRHMPMITLGLIAGLFQMCTDHGIQYCYAAMEPTLLRLLKGFGINFQPLGMPVEYHGMRVPSIFRVNEMYQAMQQRPELRDIIGSDEHPHQSLSSFNEAVAV